MIEIKNLTKTFHTANGDITALQDVSLTVRDGEIYGIIGLSGAGKSTLVRCMNLLERPTCGQVLVDGRVETICQLSARLIVNTAAMKLHRTEILEFIEKCRGALE